MPGLNELLTVAGSSNTLYLSPDTIMPLASILAAVLGFLLIFWRVVVNFFKKMTGRGKEQTISGDELVDPDISTDPQENI